MSTRPGRGAFIIGVMLLLASCGRDGGSSASSTWLGAPDQTPVEANRSRIMK